MLDMFHRRQAALASTASFVVAIDIRVEIIEINRTRFSIKYLVAFELRPHTEIGE